MSHRSESPRYLALAEAWETAYGYAQSLTSKGAVQQQGLDLSSTSGVSIGCWAVEGGGGEQTAEAMLAPLRRPQTSKVPASLCRSSDVSRTRLLTSTTIPHGSSFRNAR